jgi:tRNA nucleotidyltransferase (CCA-adding enzyme)
MRDDPTKDVDVEVFGIELEPLREILQGTGRVDDVGRSFGVLRVRGLDADFSLPRRDSKAGRGHRGIRAEVDPALSVAEAARRRDLTVNALYLDPLRAELQDPYGGLEDLRAGLLRAVDADSFGEDPLRALRVMQFAARFEMRVDGELLEICRRQALSELSGERVFEEFAKWAQRGRKPSRGLDFLARTGLLRYFPELQGLVGVPQDPQWHPEGDVWIHTQLVTDAAADFRRGERRWDLSLMFGALCHDLGKPATTVDDGEHIRSHSHDVAGMAPVATLLGRMRAPLWLVEAVQALTREHLVPMNFLKGGAKDRAYRRLARRLGRSGVSLELLERVARADHLGRTTEEARAGSFPAGDEFLRKAQNLEVAESAPVDVVHGRDLLGRGFQPGPELGRILARCRKVQDETGWTDAERILDRVLG